MSYKVFEKQDWYEKLLYIYPFTTLIQLTEFIGSIQHCVTVVGICIFDSNIPFEISLTCDYMYYCCTSYNKTIVMNGYKGVFKSMIFYQQIRIIFS